MTAAEAPTQQQTDWCSGGAGVTPDMQVRLHSDHSFGHYSGKTLAIAFAKHGDVYFDAEDFNCAIADFDEPIRLNPKDADGFDAAPTPTETRRS